MSAHTPGPWDRETFIDAAATVAASHGNEWTDATVEANATVAAAATDLAEALRQIVQMPISYTAGETARALDNARQIASAALANAGMV